MAIIKSDSSSLETVRDQFEVNYNNYTTNYEKLTEIMNKISGGEIKGPVADAFKKQYEAKEDILQALKTTLDKAEGRMQEEKERLSGTINNMIDNIE